MPIPHSIHPEISEETAIWKGKGGCQGDYKDIVPIQKGRNSRRGGMYRPCTFMCMYTTQDKHPELQSKWSKAFWARGYYVATVGNITEDAIKKYIKEQSEESRKEDSEGAAF